MAGGQSTFAEPIFVGSEVHAEIIGKFLIPFLRGLLSEDANVRDLPIEGHLSVWIKRFRDKPVEFTGIKLGGKRKAVVRLISNLLEFMSRLWDPNKAQKTVELVESYFSSKDLRQLENALAARNYGAVNATCNAIARKSGFQMNFDIGRFVATLRAMKATALCLTLHAADPTRLIEQARAGNKQAVLRLVQTDRLFLTDRCTQKVIRQANLENDRRFMKQLARAQLYDRRIREKSAHRFLLYGLFALKSPLPKPVHLHYLLDPDGSTFKTTEAFTRFFERCRNDFESLRSGAPR